MNNTKILNKCSLKYKILKDIFTFLPQSKHFKNINFKNFNNISIFEKSKCLIVSKNLSNYLKENKIYNLSNSSLISIIKHTLKENLRMCKKNIELIKFYTMLFTERECSHLALYLFNNSNIYEFENKECLSIVIDKNTKYSVILNEHLNVFTKKDCKHPLGEVFLYEKSNSIYTNVKHKVCLFVFSIIIGYLLVYNIPSNYVIMEMNSTMHMKMNHKGNIISYKPKTSSAKHMINNTKQLNKKINDAIPCFINYGLENKMIRPGEKVKIYILGPPLSNKFFENLKNSLQNVPLNVVINNSGNLIKINRS